MTRAGTAPYQRGEMNPTGFVEDAALAFFEAPLCQANLNW